ncbi:MAG: hypothetical protein IT542_04320 [Rubellimicrobium sp.]|nr:hypothetical protein [Rubellimicrobium sp.]
MRLRTVLPLCLALGACGGAAPVPQQSAAVPAPAPLPVGAADTCGAASHAGLIGQRATALERVLLMRPVRLIRDGAAPDGFLPGRIGFHIAIPPGTPPDLPVTLAERITAISCG